MPDIDTGYSRWPVPEQRSYRFQSTLRPMVLAGTVMTDVAMGSDYGYTDVAYRLMESTDYPSWLYPVVHGATTVWERWDSYTRETGFEGNATENSETFTSNAAMNSFNHYSLGAVVAWLYNYSLGIQRDEQVPGFKHFILQPQPGGSLSSARGHIQTAYGPIESEWHTTDERFDLTASVPANTTATLFLPAATADTVLEVSSQASEAAGVRFVREEEGKAVYELQSGTYHFTSALPSH